MMAHKQAVPGADDIIRVELENGIIVLARPNMDTASVVVRGYLPVGSLFDPKEKMGLADFTASALMRGTKQRNTQEIFDALESIGASLGFGSGTHTTSFSGKALAEDLGLVLTLAAESLRTPSFPQDQLEKLRAGLMTSLALRAENTGARAGMAFDDMVYANHPYSNPEEGHPETVSGIDLEDIADFHDVHYGPRGMVISIVGGVDPQAAVEQVRAALGDWKNPQQPEEPALPDLTPLTEEGYQRIAISGKSQSDLVIGTSGPARLEEDYLAAAVGNNILGRFGMMGRIGDVVREQAGLAYYASSSLGGGVGPGAWYITAGVNPANEEKATDLIKQEVRRFATELVTEEELSDSKANFIGRLPISLEGNAGVASTILHLEKFGLGMDYYRNYAERINAITREDILAVAAKYLDADKLAIGVAGPGK